VIDRSAYLLERWHATTEERRSAGALWYPRALALAEELAPSASMGAGVLAALSPHQGWKGNVTMARRALAGDPAGLPAQVAKVRAIMGGADPLDVLRGPKERAFYRAIMGDTSALVIDRWAARAAGVPSPDGSFTRGEWRELHAAYEAASGAAGVLPRDFQATLWIEERGSAE
jgi:hypothetical protein